jgi:hypothetical protein
MSSRSVIIYSSSAYIRPWCSWEMGAFATNTMLLDSKKQRQFFISFQETPPLISEGSPLMGFQPFLGFEEIR